MSDNEQTIWEHLHVLAGRDRNETNDETLARGLGCARVEVAQLALLLRCKPLRVEVGHESSTFWFSVEDAERMAMQWGKWKLERGD